MLSSAAPKKFKSIKGLNCFLSFPIDKLMSIKIYVEKTSKSQSL